jgi:hypothetical protein
MISRSIKLALVVAVLVCAAGVSYSQPPTTGPQPSVLPSGMGRPPRGNNGADPTAAMMARMRAERDKKEHQEMLDRGDEALKLANELEAAFAKNKNLSAEDRDRLESLESVVEKIRKELGGDDDDDIDIDSELTYPKAPNEERPSTMEEAFKFLHSTTVKLVDELKKTTRFSISAVAIQTSNSVLKIVKFLRLRK